MLFRCNAYNETHTVVFFKEGMHSDVNVLDLGPPFDHNKFELQTLCTKYNLDFNLKISVNWFLKSLWNAIYVSIDN